MGSGFSEMAHSVVSSREATEAAFSRAVRGHLLGVDDAGLDEVFVFAGSGVEAEAVLALADLFHNDGAFKAGVVGDLAQRSFDGRCG